MDEPVIYIVDDDPSVRKALMRLLNSAGMTTEAYASAVDFLEFCDYDRNGCLILDVKMKNMSGPELHEKLLQQGCEIPIIFLTAHGDVPTSVDAMKKGAMDFLTKPVDASELFDAIQLALKKDEEMRFNREEHSSFIENIKSLTPREYEVMTYVITGILNKQIAHELSISEETVKVHRGRLMQKLEIVSVAELVRLCEKTGINSAQIKGKY